MSHKTVTISHKTLKQGHWAAGVAANLRSYQEDGRRAEQRYHTSSPRSVLARRLWVDYGQLMNRMSMRKRHNPDSQQTLSAPADDEKSWITAYEELCNRHQQIDDFRGKLLALLPIASGAAALVLLLSSSKVEKYLLPIGIYGLAITFGLFIYELHGIAVCKQIMEQAEDLEVDLKIPKGRRQYRDRNRNLLHKVIEIEIASWIVYLSVLAGWVYIAGVGGGWWHHTSPILIVWLTGIIVVAKWFYAVVLEHRVHKKYVAD